MPIEITLSINKAKAIFKHFMIGNWILTSNAEDREKEKELEELKSWFLSIMKNYEIEEEIEYDDKHNEYILKEEKYEEIFEIVNEFSEEYFWEEIAYKLAVRDMNLKYSAEELQQMDDEKRLTIMFQEEKKYLKEITENGIDNLYIKK